MKVLIACEESQEVCKAFRELGHQAFSCDILPCSGGFPEHHIQDDIRNQLKKDWDMILAFPPCTHLCVSGARHFKQKIEDGRQQQGIDFFMLFVDCNCERIAIENPIGIMSTKWRKPDQIIHPYMFGDNVSKSTCLWLKNLPKLVPTNIVKPDILSLKNGKYKMSRFHYDSFKLPPEERSRIRSKTFPGIAKAMAQQWGKEQ